MLLKCCFWYLIACYISTYCVQSSFIECSYGHYGPACRERCNGHCVNNETCDHVSGVCPSGCQDGFVGPNCNNSKNYIRYE